MGVEERGMIQGILRTNQNFAVSIMTQGQHEGFFLYSTPKAFDNSGHSHRHTPMLQLLELECDSDCIYFITLFY